jgi:hypothetical protein
MGLIAEVGMGNAKDEPARASHLDEKEKKHGGGEKQGKAKGEGEGPAPPGFFLLGVGEVVAGAFHQ